MTEDLHDKKKHAVIIGYFGHMFNDVKTSELALVPCPKLYHLIIYLYRESRESLT